MNFEIHLKILSIDHRISISMQLIILAVVVLSTAASFWESEKILVLVTGMVIGVAGLLTLLRYPNLGFVLLFVGGMFVPFVGLGGFNASILTIIIMAVLWFFVMFVAKGEFKFLVSPTSARHSTCLLFASWLLFC
jgi:hypothetical protein